MTCVVRANVVDVNFDVGKSSDVIWVDTSVWVKITYTKIKPLEAEPYVQFIKRLKKAGGALVVGAVCFAEVGKVVESRELDIWMRLNHDKRDHSMVLKIFRSDPTQRAAVVAEVSNCWKQMHSMARCSAATISSSCVDQALDGLTRGDFLDGPDAVQVAEARRNGISQILTADHDFSSVPGLTVFTAFQKSITEAAGRGLQLSR